MLPMGRPPVLFFRDPPNPVGFVPRGDPFPRAPTHECLLTCAKNLAASENQTILLNQMEALIQKIRNDLLVPKRRDRASTPESVALIFRLCAYLDLSDTTKYLACEIHDRLIMKGSTEAMSVANYGQSYGFSNDREVRCMPMQDLASLQIVSCVQLAHKAYSYGAQRRCLRTPDLLTALHSFGMGFHTRVTDILQSEIGVMKALDFYCTYATGLDVVELVMLHLGFNQTEYRRIYSIAIQCLDRIHLERAPIMNLFYDITVARFSNMLFERKQFRELAECNKFVEGSGTLVAALVLLELEESQMFHVLAQIIAEKVDLQLVFSFSAAIIRHTHMNAKDILAASKITKEIPSNPTTYYPANTCTA